MVKSVSLTMFCLLMLSALSAQQPMLTPWSKQVNRALPLNEYPRPEMVRKQWANLNGSWDYAIEPASNNFPARWQGKILVPFPVESYLSGVQKRVSPDSALWYRRSFTVKAHGGGKVLLYFGAIDWKSEVFLNGSKIARHEGGYDGFSMDITSFLKAGEQSLVVKVWDPTDAGEQGRGKQVRNPKGIYYTPVTGIWQTVWYEIVPPTYIASYRSVADIDQSRISIQPDVQHLLPGDNLSLDILLNGRKVVSAAVSGDQSFDCALAKAQLWTPAAPHLYYFRMKVMRKRKMIDEVEGYFGMRKIEVAKDRNGSNRIYLNHLPLFQYGPLDQGYWPDGIYTAPTEEALLSDINAMKDMGFNMVRKHVKVEPSRWYYHCDRLGLIVWQDMPSGYGEIVPVKDHDKSVKGDSLALLYPDVKRSAASEEGFRTEWKNIITQLYNHPSICVWVPFNESWGQFKTNEIIKWTKSLDPSRLVDGPSGWIDRGEGDFHDYHLYGNRLSVSFPLENRALVIGEFGGLGYLDTAHAYSKKVWSYHGFRSTDSLRLAYDQLVDRLMELKAQGFSAAVYTQLTDVETEINGIISYDRKLIKINSGALKKAHEKLYLLPETAQDGKPDPHLRIHAAHVQLAADGAGRTVGRRVHRNY